MNYQFVLFVNLENYVLICNFLSYLFKKGLRNKIKKNNKRIIKEIFQ